ncbi:MAG TPA: hypothetical protein PKN95_07625 [Verrucomicrobiota bacterium]|nr:hypothetical protein [Verrucomicrobiota bacterium]HNT14997.1 hypothetical protein [Verrucomicrobiota bacterium]
MKKTLLTTAVIALVTGYAGADVVYITSRPNPTGTGPQNDGTYIEYIIPFGDYGAKGTAPGRPATGGTTTRCYIGGAIIDDPNAGADLMPVLGTPGGTYEISYNFNSLAGNTSTDVVFSVSADYATLSFTETDKFQRKFGSPANVWQHMGYLTNDVNSSTPVIKFRYQSGRITASDGNRMIFDAWRFTLVEPCLAVPVATVIGPAGASSAQVTVAGIDASATSIRVYQDSGNGLVQVGEKTTDISAGNNAVPVSGLVKGARVVATQTVNGQEGCLPEANTGLLVGGGANPTVRIALSIRETTSEGPIGDPGISSSGNIHFLGATDMSGGAPINAPIVYPSNDWQTVTFDRGSLATVGDATGLVASTTSESGYNPTDIVDLQVFAYRTLPNGLVIYSETPAQSATVTSNDVFAVNWAWDAVAGADGYRLLRSYWGAGFFEYVDVTGNQYHDANNAWIYDPEAADAVLLKTAQSGPSIQWNPSASNTNNLPGNWGILEAIAFTVDDPGDTGPFNLYIDNLKNGDTTFQTFETAPAGSTDYGFRVPRFSGSTSANLIDAPNIGAVSSQAADTGTKSFRVSFQWVGNKSTAWLRLTTSGVNNPQVNLNEPISFRLLMQPVGATPPPPPAAPTLSVVKTDAGVVLNWEGGHRLQSATAASGPYVTVPQTISPNVWTNITSGAFLSPWTNNFSEPVRFFRLAD